MQNKQIICPHCKSESVKKDDKRKTENIGEIFVLDDGFFRMRNNPQKKSVGTF